MAYCEIAFPILAPAGKAWRWLSWTGARDLVATGKAPFEHMEVEPPAPEPGSVRTLLIAGHPPVSEQLVAYDEGAMAYDYRVIDAGPLPATNYRGRVSVTAAGPDRCMIGWRCWADPVGISDAEWIGMWTDIETALAATVRDLAEQRPEQG